MASSLLVIHYGQHVGLTFMAAFYKCSCSLYTTCTGLVNPRKDFIAYNLRFLTKSISGATDFKLTICRVCAFLDY